MAAQCCNQVAGTRKEAQPMKPTVHATADPTRKQFADCNSISSAWRNEKAKPTDQRCFTFGPMQGSTPAALGNPLHILSHARAMMIEQIMAVDERTPERRRQLVAMSDEELNAEYREVIE
jgi:hypothetical protein